MVNEHGLDVFPKESLAVQVTVVVPRGKVDPAAGAQLTMHPCAGDSGGLTPTDFDGGGLLPPPFSQGQSAVGLKSTTAEQRVAPVEIVKLSGQTIVGVVVQGTNS